MLSLDLIVAILATHYVADFILQPPIFATNKSKHLWALAGHVAIYTAVLGIAAAYLGLGWQWAVGNGMMHFAVDFFSSKVCSYLYSRKNIYGFFVVLGLDQLLHQMCLLCSI